MSAARVLNPSVLSEFCKISASPNTMGRNLPCGRQLNHIKRDLFGHANPIETQRIFNEELEKHQERAIRKWGFDFRNGLPLNANSQFVWERVSFQESAYAPDMYTLTRVAHVRPVNAPATSYDMLMDERADRENYISDTLLSTSTDTDSCDESHDEIVFKLPAVAGLKSTDTSLTLSYSKSQMRKRQPKITEYMKERKRLAQTPKKVSPAKRMRTTSGGNNSSSLQHISHSAYAQSVSAHFALRSQQPRK